VQVGDTVSLRVVTRAGPTDVVGTLISVSADAVELRRRDGNVMQITRTSIAAGRVVPPGPAERITVAELEQTAALGWRALESERLGAWSLRASGGFTRRANSALAVGDAGLPPPTALDAVTAWYAGRGLRPRIAVAPADAPAELVTLLDDRGWAPEGATEVMTSELGPVLRAAAESEAASDPRLDAEPDEAWLATFRQDTAGGLHPVAHRLLTNHDVATFASIRDGDRCVAIARATVDGRWAGLSCVEVVPDRRGEGLATVVSVAALRWAVAQRARRAYLQVVVGNVAARAVYDRLGFRVHHDYVYRTAPEASVTSLL
jgi:RimJ/RimL family protein N-acetyltransferase